MWFRGRKIKNTWRELLGEYYSVPIDIVSVVDVLLGRSRSREPELYPEKILGDSRVLEILGREDIINTIKMFEEPLASRIAWRFLYNAYIGRDEEKIKNIVEVLSSHNTLEYLDGVREEEIGFNPIVYLFSVAAGTRDSSYVVQLARYLEECGEDVAVELSSLSDILVYGVRLDGEKLEKILNTITSYDCTISSEVAKRLSQLFVFRELRDPELATSIVELVGRLRGDEAIEVLYNAVEVLSRLDRGHRDIAREYFSSISSYSGDIARELSNLVNIVSTSTSRVEELVELLELLRREDIRSTIEGYRELAPFVVRGLCYAYRDLVASRGELATRLVEDLRELWNSRDKILYVVEHYKFVSREALGEIVSVLARILVSLGSTRFEELVDLLVKEEVSSLLQVLGDKSREDLQDMIRRIGQLLYLVGGDTTALYNILRAIRRIEARDLPQLVLSLVTISSILRDTGASNTLISSYTQKIAILLQRYRDYKVDEVLGWLINVATIMRDGRAPPENYGLILRALESVGVKLVDLVKPEKIVEKALTARSLRDFTASLEKLYTS